MDVYYLAEFGDSKYRACPLLREMVAMTALGRKTGRSDVQLRNHQPASCRRRRATAPPQSSVMPVALTTGCPARQLLAKVGAIFLHRRPSGSRPCTASFRATQGSAAR